MRKIALCCILALAATLPAAFAFDVSPTQTPGEKLTKSAPVQVAPEAISTLLENRTFAQGVEFVTFTDDGMQMSSARGTLSEPLVGDLDEAGRDFIVLNAKMFNVPVNKAKDILKVVRNEETSEAGHISYAMVIDGVPVHQAMIELHTDKNRKVILANGSLPTVKKITNQITLGRIEAVAAAKRALGITKMRNVARAELAINPENHNGRMVFVVKLAAAQPLGDWEILIDADTGEEISRLNQMVFQSSPTGRGDVYVSHPLAGSPTEEDLTNLTTSTLKGKFVNVVNEDGPTAVSESNTHKYDPTDTHFDEVNIYFYVNTIHTYFKSLGCTTMDKALKATVHLGDKYDNAYFSPWEDAIAFGDGNKLNSLAKEESVCFHEYGHATINTIVKLNYSAESGAMNEGQADYFACSLSNDTSLGEWAVKKMGKPYLRTMLNNYIYPKDIQNQVHWDGQIWGATLWDLRTALGAEISDKLVFKGHSFLKSGSPKFVDGFNAILAADKTIFAGKNAEQITSVFKKRGIVNAGTTPVLNQTDLKRIGSFNQVHGN